MEQALRAVAYSRAGAGTLAAIERLVHRCAAPALLVESSGGGMIGAINAAARGCLPLVDGPLTCERVFGVPYAELQILAVQGSRGMRFETRGVVYRVELDPVPGAAGRALAVIVHLEPESTPRIPVARPASAPPPSVPPPAVGLAQPPGLRRRPRPRPSDRAGERAIRSLRGDAAPRPPPRRDRNRQRALRPRDSRGQPARRARPAPGTLRASQLWLPRADAPRSRALRLCPRCVHGRLAERVRRAPRRRTRRNALPRRSRRDARCASIRSPPRARRRRLPPRWRGTRAPVGLSPRLRHLPRPPCARRRRRLPARSLLSGSQGACVALPPLRERADRVWLAEALLEQTAQPPSVRRSAARIFRSRRRARLDRVPRLAGQRPRAQERDRARHRARGRRVRDSTRALSRGSRRLRAPDGSCRRRSEDARAHRPRSVRRDAARLRRKLQRSCAPARCRAEHALPRAPAIVTRFIAEEARAGRSRSRGR